MPQSKEQKQRIADIVSSKEDEAARIDQVAKVRGWFRPAENSTFYPTVLAYMETKIDLNTAATQLFGQIDDKIIAQKLDDVSFHDLWYSIIHSVKRKSFHEAEEDGTHNLHLYDRAVDLVDAFRAHKIKDHEEYNYIYNSLTDFGMSCREVINDEPEPDASGIEIDAWANTNYFFARITEIGVQNLSLFAIWAMRSALENEQQDDVEGTAAQKYNVYVPAAAAWLFGMGHALYAKEEDLTPTDRKQGNPAKGGDLWKGKAEFSKDRWALWKERLAAISKMEGVSDKTRSISRDAIEAMERAESFS